MNPNSKPGSSAAADAASVRLRRLREDAQRPIAVNLEETIALSHALVKTADAAKRRKEAAGRSRDIADLEDLDAIG
jgi:hypothetical protein